MRFHDTTTHCFELFFIANLRLRTRFHDAWLTLFWSSSRIRISAFQPLSCSTIGAVNLSSFLRATSRKLGSFFILFVIWIDKVNSSQVFEHCRTSVLLLPVPVSLDSERLYQFSSKVLAIHHIVWLLFESLSISTQHQISFWRFLIQ